MSKNMNLFVRAEPELVDSILEASRTIRIRKADVVRQALYLGLPELVRRMSCRSELERAQPKEN